MKITVLNGSPKGEIGVTLQYVEYIQKNHPGCEFQVFHVGREDYGQTTALIKGLADDLMWASQVGLGKPPSFLGVGGHKVFRDMIYGMRGVFKTDHDFYRENRMYDFPRTDLKIQAMNLLFYSMRLIPSTRKMMHNDANKRMIMPLEQVLRK